MFNLDKFISDSVTFRPSSMFKGDIESNAEKLTQEIKGKKVCVIGGAGSIGSSFIKAVLRFEPASVVVVDLNENGLAEQMCNAIDGQERAEQSQRLLKEYNERMQNQQRQQEAVQRFLREYYK